MLSGSALSAQNGNGTAGDAVWRPGFLPEGIPGWAIDGVASIAVLALSWLVARLLVRLFSRRLARYFERPSLTRVSLAGIRAGAYVFGLLLVLRINGLDLGNIALSVTIFSAVVGVILAPIVGSIVSGVFLLADQPYEIGDMIELTDRETRGFVDDITLRYTKMVTLENTFLVVPNGEMRQRDVVNYSAEDARVRLTLDVMVTYESDVDRARRRIEQGARDVEEVVSGGPAIRIGRARYPAAPDCLIGRFADNGILLRLRYWITEPYRMQTVRSKVQTNVWTALDDESIEIAYPHSHLVFDETSGELQVSTPAESGDAVGRPEPGGAQSPEDRRER